MAESSMLLPEEILEVSICMALMEAVASICLASAIMTRAYGGRISMFPALAVGLSALMVMLSLPETLSSPALMFTALARIRRITYEEKTEKR